MKFNFPHIAFSFSIGSKEREQVDEITEQEANTLPEEHHIPDAIGDHSNIEATNYSSLGYGVYSSPWTPISTEIYNGEKTPGELGTVKQVIPDYNAIRLRAYEQELKNDIVKIIAGRYFQWVIGKGLKLQCEPDTDALESEGVTSDLTDFIRFSEARFRIFAASKKSDYSKMQNLHDKARDAFRSGFIGGDMLTVLRVENGRVNVQIFDGQEVMTPTFDNVLLEEVEARGNIVVHGIEINKRGEHVSYFVRVIDFQTNGLLYKFERFEARGKNTGLLLAWMYYGSKHRMNHQRGVSELAAVLEKIDKTDRYTEAAVGGAEERAKVPFFIEHSKFSDGENPLGVKLKQKTKGRVDIDPYDQGEILSKAVAATESKTVYNMPVGAKMNAINSQTEIQYDSFFSAVFNQIAAGVGVPPEVAMQKYSSNYSASRAAILAWEYIVELKRQDFSENFYKNIYNVWLWVEIMSNRIQAPDYLKAIVSENDMIVEAYSKCSFVGTKMPHIDLKKEADAIRVMLGLEDNAPLISREQAAERLGVGSWNDNFKKNQEESKIIPKPEPKEDATSNSNTAGE